MSKQNNFSMIIFIIGENKKLKKLFQFDWDSKIEVSCVSRSPQIYVFFFILSLELCSVISFQFILYLFFGVAMSSFHAIVQVVF